MATLVGIGLVAGLITALSPCVLPVLPILLAGGATGGGRRPYAIVAGVVAGFTVFTLTATALLDALGLPQDALRDAAIAVLLVAAAAIVFPRLGDVLARPLFALSRRRPGDLGGGFVLGLSLALVFVPCAGPVLAAVAVLAASRDLGAGSVVLTGAYAVGAAAPMLAVAILGRRAALRLRSPFVRPALGAVMAAAAVAIALDLPRPLQTAVPGYAEAVQERVESSAAADRALGRLTGARSRAADGLEDYGPAPELAGIAEWINSRPLTLAGLRGKVVVVDFWTYSCINCLRTLPYLRAWDEAYRDDGLVILGVHTPEFAFEREPANVRRAVRDLGVEYPVALDNGYDTWNAFANRYWPAKYVVDREGRVRYAHFGEGAYERTEQVLRALLAERGPEPTGAGLAERETPSAEITPESYLGYGRLDRYAGSAIVPDRAVPYRFPRASLPTSHLAFDGTWTVGRERATAALGGRLRLHFVARAVHLVLAGRGTVDVLVDGEPLRTVEVGEPDLYTLARFREVRDALLELRFSPGVSGYAFTFGAGADEDPT